MDAAIQKKKRRMKEAKAQNPVPPEDIDVNTCDMGMSPVV
jgi:hypothetical protein